MVSLPDWLSTFCLTFLGLFGLLFGSFANVLIWRVPRDESIVSPGSHCPRCGHDIRWYDNIPVVSWLLLGRKCRDCGEPIPWRYPAVELASGALWVIAGLRWGFSATTPLAISFFYMLLVLSVIDLDTRRLPTPLVAVIGITGVIASVAASLTGLPFAPLAPVSTTGLFANPLVASALGFVLGAGTSFGIAFLYSILRGRDGLGFGDVRLLGAMGIVLGPLVLLAYALANFIGVAAAVPALMAARKAAVDGERPAPASFPFGPFLALGAVLTALWGPAVWAWYLHLLGAA